MTIVSFVKDLNVPCGEVVELTSFSSVPQRFIKTAVGVCYGLTGIRFTEEQMARFISESSLLHKVDCYKDGENIGPDILEMISQRLLRESWSNTSAFLSKLRVAARLAGYH